MLAPHKPVDASSTPAVPLAAASPSTESLDPMYCPQLLLLSYPPCPPTGKPT